MGLPLKLANIYPRRIIRSRSFFSDAVLFFSFQRRLRDFSILSLTSFKHDISTMPNITDLVNYPLQSQGEHPGVNTKQWSDKLDGHDEYVWKYHVDFLVSNVYNSVPDHILKMLKNAKAVFALIQEAHAWGRRLASVIETSIIEVAVAMQKLDPNAESFHIRFQDFEGSRDLEDIYKDMHPGSNQSEVLKEIERATVWSCGAVLEELRSSLRPLASELGRLSFHNCAESDKAETECVRLMWRGKASRADIRDNLYEDWLGTMINVMDRNLNALRKFHGTLSAVSNRFEKVATKFYVELDSEGKISLKRLEQMSSEDAWELVKDELKDVLDPSNKAMLGREEFNEALHSILSFAHRYCMTEVEKQIESIRRHFLKPVEEFYSQSAEKGLLF